MWHVEARTRDAPRHSTMAASVPKEVKVELDEAARLMVLKKYESAADVFASALESLYACTTNQTRRVQ